MLQRFLATLLALTILSVSSAYEVTKLYREDYDEVTHGKTVFIKFFAPWCAFCKRLAPAWEKLAEEWDGNEVGLVAEIDCTSKLEKLLCARFDIESFPTMMYGDPSDLTEYEGGRTYEELSEFAKENLVPICNPENLDLCDEQTKALVEEYNALGDAQLQVMISLEKKKIESAEAEWQKLTETLQEQYEDATRTRDEAIHSIREGGLNLMQSVKKSRGNGAKGKSSDSDSEAEL